VLLVVTDDPRAVVEMRKVASDAGAVVVHASSGPDTMRNLEVSQPTGLLIEAAMPTLDGFALCRKIRRARPDVRVGLLVPSDRSDLIALAEKAEVDVVLRHPVLAADLTAFFESCAKLDACKG
jgi:CheY-like chemotaxis protein